jgi:pimeloyl-ACP methyl ester carboxylesterase
MHHDSLVSTDRPTGPTGDLSTGDLPTGDLSTGNLSTGYSFPEPTLHSFYWRWQGQSYRAIYEVHGSGPPILLLPALSTISSREEMQGLAAYLALKHQVVLLDWLGFGDSDRPALDYTPGLYTAFLRDFVQATFHEPVVVMAAGHSAGYVMELAQRQTPLWSWVVLLAPTWRGPLPTMMGESRRNLYRLVQRVLNLPVVGSVLYYLNTTRGFLHWMMGRHVYGDRANLSRPLVRRKQQIARRAGARFAAGAFVTGALDPIRSRGQWLDWFQPLPMPVMVVIGDHLPPKSREEMEVLAHFTSVQVYRTYGSLGLHEEYSDQVASGVLTLLEKYLTKN